MGDDAGKLALLLKCAGAILAALHVLVVVAASRHRSTGPFVIGITLVLVVEFGGPCGGRRDPGSASSGYLLGTTLGIIYHNEKSAMNGTLDEHGDQQAAAPA